MPHYTVHKDKPSGWYVADSKGRPFAFFAKKNEAEHCAEYFNRLAKVA